MNFDDLNDPLKNLPAGATVSAKTPTLGDRLMAETLREIEAHAAPNGLEQADAVLSNQAQQQVHVPGPVREQPPLLAQLVHSLASNMGKK